MAPNRLAREKSPYLLQHQDNPVAWYAWGEEAFAAARDHDKPIFLSIGYSTCHWCHVMAHDSFEDDVVAQYLNQHFICIKLDREERPDIDQIYMDAVVAFTGHGGWPLSAFLTPDLKPFFGGTFFWKAQFVELLQAIQTAWIADRNRLQTQGNYVAETLQRQGAHDTATAGLTAEILRAAMEPFRQRFDPRYGGFGSAPKFPPSMSVQLLLRLHQRFGDAEALRMATTTLDRMARGGIYDHLGGGFARYATDAQWLVPHFEKMLYDNALLSFTYLEAYQVTRDPMYASVARETLEYMLRRMTDPAGGFYSAEDADSEGEEGKFYVWTYEALQRALSPEELARMVSVYGVTPHGNFEHHTNILHLADSQAWSMKTDPILQQAQRTLFALREQRVHPHVDDKVLTAWNGLMIRAMAKAYQVLGDPRYLRAAQHAATFLHTTMMREDRVLRRYRDGEAAIDGFLEDYAYLIAGLLTLYQSDFDLRWLQWAEALQHTQDALLWDGAQPGYFYAPAASDVVVRNKELHDGALPSANAVAAENLLRLFALTTNDGYRTRAHALLPMLAEAARRAPSACAYSLSAIDYALAPSLSVVVAGDLADPVAHAVRAHCYHTFLPHLTFVMGAPNTAPLLRDRPIENHRATIYICVGNTCQPAVDTFEAARALIMGEK